MKLNKMSSKTLVGIHWLSLVWLLVILILSSITLYQNELAKKADDPTNNLNYIRGLTISLVVLTIIILFPLLYWCYKQSKIGFSSDMIEVMF